MLVQGNVQTQQQLTGPGFGGIAVVFGEYGFKLGSMHVIIFGSLQIGVNGIAFGHGCPHFGVAHHDDVQYPLVFIGKLILTQITEPFIRR